MKKLLVLILSVAFLISACENDTPTPDCNIEIDGQARIFEFLHTSSGATFLAWTTDSTVIQQVEAQLSLQQSERSQHINGKILRLPQNCNLNQQWSWYFAPNEWALADISIEVCDGNPQFVEENLDEFVDNVGRFCPWSSVVLREITN